MDQHAWPMKEFYGETTQHRKLFYLFVVAYITHFLRSIQISFLNLALCTIMVYIINISKVCVLKASPLTGVVLSGGYKHQKMGFTWGKWTTECKQQCSKETTKTATPYLGEAIYCR